MSRKLLKYQGAVNRFTYSLKYNYSIHSGYSDDVENWVPPATGSSWNTTLSFRGPRPFIATVDWGDGQVEQFYAQRYGSSEYGNYILTFRSFMTDVQDNATSRFPYQTVPPHHYADDDRNTLRTITIVFSDSIHYVGNSYNHLASFPVLEFPELVALYIDTPNDTMGELPFDTFSHIPNLRSLQVSDCYVSNTVIPDSLWTMTGLTSLRISGVFVSATDIETCGIRNINKLVNLETFDGSTSVWSSKYLKEYNELPKLTSLTLDPSSRSYGFNDPDIGVNNMPIMDEVDNINPNLTTFIYIDDYKTSYRRTAWPYHLSGYGWGNIRNINMYCARNVVLDPFPEYWYEHRNATSISIRESLRTQQRADDFVNLFYDFVTNWEQITMSQTAKDGKRNQWYNFTVGYLDPTGNSPNTIPSGLYVVPEGFVEGVSNGNPKTPMEKIYVLMKNYKQKWNTFDKPTS